MRQAWGVGATSVNADDLHVNWEGRNPTGKSGLIRVPDHETPEAIRQVLTYDPRVSSHDIEITAWNGTVTLQGAVSHLEAKAVAEDPANNTVGVYRVKNVLKIPASAAAPDSEIQNNLRAAARRDPYLNQESLQVSVHDWRVYLNGKVPMTFQKMHAETVASRVRGVIGVVNRIHAPFQWLWKSDWKIKQDVRQALR